MSDTVTINCLVRGQSTQNAFAVDIDKTKLIGIMSKAEVEAAKDNGTYVEATGDPDSFFIASANSAQAAE